MKAVKKTTKKTTKSTSKAKSSSKPIITEHILIPKHSKLSDKDKKRLFEKYNITFNELPLISGKDPAVKQSGLEQGDVVKIVRDSPTSGQTVFYRGVK